MSIKLMKQRWLVEETADDKRDSMEIVDMDVDEKEEYSIISELEKPANFFPQGGFENERPKANGIDIKSQGTIANLEAPRKKKKPSRWDVGAPLCIQLYDVLTSNTNKVTKELEKCADGGSSEGKNEMENKKNSANEEIAEKVASMKLKEGTVSVEEPTTTGNISGGICNSVDMPLNAISHPSNFMDIALPPEPSECEINVNNMQVADTTEEKYQELMDEICSDNTSTDEAHLSKPKVVMKWKLTKTSKKLPTANAKKFWEPETVNHKVLKVHIEEKSPTSETYTDAGLVKSSSFGENRVTNIEDLKEVGRNHIQTMYPPQELVQVAEMVSPQFPCSEQVQNSEPDINAAAVLEQKQCPNDEEHEIYHLRNESMPQKCTSEDLNEMQLRSNKIQEPNDSFSKVPLQSSSFDSVVFHNRNILEAGAKTLTDGQTKSLSNEKFTDQAHLPCTVMFLSQKAGEEQELKPLSTECEDFRQWQTQACTVESNVATEQESSFGAAAASSGTSPVSTYSFTSTPKTPPSPDVAVLQTVINEQLRESSKTCDFSNVTCTLNTVLLPPKAPLASIKDDVKTDVVVPELIQIQAAISQPTPYEPLEENIILCDENLIKEAKVVRCFCEPTPEELAEGRGCSLGCINRELYTECGSRCPSGNSCANRRFHNRQYAKVEVFNAGVKGWGLRAVEPLEPGRFIIEYVGEVIDADEMLRRGKRYGKDPKHVHHYLMALKNGAVIDATLKGNVSRFINHSCDPNCESQKWTVDRQLRVGFFAIKPIAIGEEIVFDYQLERYGRKAQRCFCGAANCRGRIGDDSESEDEEEEEEEDKVNDEVDVEEDEKIPLVEPRMKAQKKAKYPKSAKKRKKRTLAQRYNKMIMNILSRGPPRNRTQVRDLVRLMVQVEQAPQRSSLIQCIRFAHPDVLRLFIQECGLRLLYVFLATDYPIDDEQSVLQLQIKSLDLLDVMPIVNRNQVNDSNLASTLEKIVNKRSLINEIVENVVRRLVDAVCCDMPSTSNNSVLATLEEDPDPILERLHCEMVIKAVKLMEKWKNLREEYRIPRRERTDSIATQHDISRYVRRTEEDGKSKRVIVDKKDDGSTLWRLSGFGPPPKKRYFDRRRFPKTESPIFIKDLTHLDNEDFKQSPIAVTDLTHLNGDDDGASKPKKRRSRFDIVGERNPSSMYELYATDCDPYAPPPPTLLPETMFAAGLPGSIHNFLYQEQPFPEFFDWNAVYTKYDPSSAAYQQFIDYYQQQQCPLVGLPPCPVTPQATTEVVNILEAPSPPPPKRPKTPEENPNMLTIGPINTENPTDQDIEMLEKCLAALKAKRAEIKKREQEEQKKAAQESVEILGAPPPPPPSQTKQSLWVQATTEEGAVYYYNKETRESVWTLPEESESGNASADTTTDRLDTRATFKAEIVKYVGGLLEPIRKLKFASADDYKYVLRKLTHTILEKELKRVGEFELKVTESVRDKARKFVAEYLTRLGGGQYSRKNKIHNAY